ncbi:MAG: M23 family metallopeptidase, partial [Propionibacteriaceae bacterium]|nr:M23 family metallopeptidase [Propionibacteriaceae bacterium]
MPMPSGAPRELSANAQIPLLPVARTSTTVTEQSSALEEAPGEDTNVLTVPSSVPTAAIPSVKPGTGTLLSMPVQGRKTSRFGMRFHPIRHVWKLHSGLDLAAPCGTPVGAAAPGTVTRTGWAGGNGIQVKIDHGMIGGHRVVTTYNHLSAIGVNVGQTVTAHQGVGRVGSTGYSTGCHLHFEVIADGNFTNPEPWLSGSTVVVDTTGMGYKQPPPGSTAPLPSAPVASPSPSASPVPSPATSAPGNPVASPSPSASP